MCSVGRMLGASTSDPIATWTNAPSRTTEKRNEPHAPHRVSLSVVLSEDGDVVQALRDRQLLALDACERLERRARRRSAFRAVTVRRVQERIGDLVANRAAPALSREDASVRLAFRHRDNATGIDSGGARRRRLLRRARRREVRRVLCGDVRPGGRRAGRRLPRRARRERPRARARDRDGPDRAAARAARSARARDRHVEGDGREAAREAGRRRHRRDDRRLRDDDRGRDVLASPTWSSTRSRT